MEDSIQIRYNIMDVSSMDAFAHVTGGYRNYHKDVYFLRFCGMKECFLQEVSCMHEQLEKMQFEKRGFYKHIKELPRLCKAEDVTFYTECYENWIKSDKKEIALKTSLKDALFEGRLNRALLETGLHLGQDNVSIQKNFYVKLMYWFDTEMAEAFVQWQPQSSMKVVACNVCKKQEYLFYYLLTQCGVDVLLLQNEKDIEVEDSLSKKYVFGQYGKCDYQNVFEKKQYREQPLMEKNQKMISIPRERTQKKMVQEQQTLQQSQMSAVQSNVKREKTYEELAQLASSIVMINIHNEKGEIIGGGSGIMIAEDGYILTNYHVAAAGRYYSVQLENEQQTYPTDELIKCNAQYDLAIIRIDRKLNPLPIYRGSQKLVRGQRIVAIGSPLGFFNTVSDGIISGFRMMKNSKEQLWDSVEMIQFTAPISEGSSGGALLNMYGELIGISSGGTNIGQNINLAVGYEDIWNFVQQFSHHTK